MKSNLINDLALIKTSFWVFLLFPGRTNNLTLIRFGKVIITILAWFLVAKVLYMMIKSSNRQNIASVFFFDKFILEPVVWIFELFHGKQLASSRQMVLDFQNWNWGRNILDSKYNFHGLWKWIWARIYLERLGVLSSWSHGGHFWCRMQFRFSLSSLSDWCWMEILLNLTSWSHGGHFWCRMRWGWEYWLFDLKYLQR